MRNRRALRAPRGFTLIELLVTAVIIGLLLAILTPAIQSAREMARVADCKNNLKQLAFASLGHHDVHGHYPTGGWGWFWLGDADRGFGADQPGGWLFNLLPYFEEYSVHELTSDGDPQRLTRAQRVGAMKMLMTPLAVINCPSRRDNTLYPLTANAGGASGGFFNGVTPRRAGRSDYAINSGHVYNEWPDSELGRGPSSYEDADYWTRNAFWGGEQSALRRYAPEHVVTTGVSFERSLVSIEMVSDGLTHTYLIGERHIPSYAYHSGYHYGDNETWCTGFNNDNYRKTGRLVDGQIVESAPIPDSSAGEPEPYSRFGSAHPGLWNAAFCDGSVRRLGYDIDWELHRDRGDRRDGLGY